MKIGVFIKYGLFFLFFIIFSGCRIDPPQEVLFTMIPSDHSEVTFNNVLDYKEEFNIYRYRNFYNGGGVALGDINNDGLLDIYFSSNMYSNQLYLNRGDFRFENITEKAGVGGTRAWSTGVAMADVNGDGWIDIYVCNSGDVKGDNKQNELFINNGDLTFSEKAEEYGLADRGFSTHGAFFDYDQDGDLDLYVLNNSYQAIGSFNLRKNERPKRDPLGGDKLYRNDGDHFTDVSVEANIYGSVIGFGLGVTVGDINKDGWLDIYVSNDFFERDYIYINNQDGTFTEKLPEMMRSISAASMGADMADINNDSYPEIFVTEMLPEDEARIKTKTTFDSWDRYSYSVDNDYYYQFTRNMLHLNNADGTFSEIGRLLDVEATDWSWGALIFDMDNDGLKDLFVANGIYQDLTDQDYIQYFSNEQVMRMIITDKNVDYQKLIDAIPSVKLSNFAFHNDGHYHFINQSVPWGLATLSHSNGSAYGDLDNDGDYDLVVNNVNMEAFIYKNESIEKTNNNKFLKFILRGEGKNTQAIGAKVTIIHGANRYYAEVVPMRGFQSCVDPRPNFGLGSLTLVDTVLVEWPGGKTTTLYQVPTSQILELTENEADADPPPVIRNVSFSGKLFSESRDQSGLNFRHIENHFVDFDRERLVYHMLSTSGPRMATGDVNGDGLIDIYIGGAKDMAGALFVQDKNGSFGLTNQELFETDKVCEDTDAEFFDADRDGDLDLYVTSGGNEFPSSSTALIDRLYFNDGKGNFTKSDQLLPASRFESSSTVKAVDFDQDGDLELFVGVRLKPFYYGFPASSYLLENDGKGHFTDVTEMAAPGLKDIGMVTDMEWADVDGDSDMDMIIVGEYLPVTIFLYQDGKFVNATGESGLEKTNGWWNCIEQGDFDKDGDIDFAAGNHGLNSRFKASETQPVCIYVSDFDDNGTVEQVICTYNGGDSYPLVLKHDLVMQIPSLKKKYLKYEAYKLQTIENIFTPEQLARTIKLDAYRMESSLFINDGQGHFTVQPMSTEAQFSPVYAIESGDFDLDGNMDLILGGNLYKVKPEVGKYDASYGLFLKGNGNGSFLPVMPKYTGLQLRDEVRDMVSIKLPKGNLLLVSRNNDSLQLFHY